MAQFDVHRNKDRRTRTEIPYLLDLQHALLDALATRVVAPLVRVDAFGKPARILNPVFRIEGKRVVMSTAEIAGVPISVLGERVDSMATQRTTILAAIDMLWSGV